MKVLFLLVLMFGSVAYACPGPDSEIAQDLDAKVKFVGEATAYQIHSVKNHALVTFTVSKTLRGENQKDWTVYFRSRKLPTDLMGFKKRFGQALEVGLREMTAPGESSESKKKAFYIVDSACSMHGEDWLIKKN